MPSGSNTPSACCGLIVIRFAHTLLNQADSALYYYNRGEEILERISDKKGLGSLWLRKGVLLDIMEGQNDSASLQAFSNAEQWYWKAKDGDRGIAISLANQGNIHRAMGHYQTAIDLLDEAITINLMSEYLLDNTGLETDYVLTKGQLLMKQGRNQAAKPFL